MSGPHPTGGSRFLYAPFSDTEAAFRRTEERLSSLEASVKRFETDHAVDQEKQKSTETRFTEIGKRLDRIDGLIGRLAWLIVAAIVGALMSFILKGGLPGV